MPRRPPPINYTTHPRCTALPYGGTQAASAAAHTITGAATETSSTVDGHDHSLAEPLDVSTNDVTVTKVTHSSAVSPALRRRHVKDMYYSVIVGKCCGVYFSW
jgi:hypothetical protein